MPPKIAGGIGTRKGTASSIWPMSAEQQAEGSLKQAEHLKAAFDKHGVPAITDAQLSVAKIAELEQQLARRTAELSAMSKELESFAYSISHDLRAPLRAVNGFTRIALEDFGAQIPEEGRRHLERVCNAGERMSELIDGLLTLSQVGRKPARRQVLVTADAVQSALAQLKPEQAGRQIELRIGALPACEADPALLKQVWVNLLSNAIKFTRERKPAIIEIGSDRQDGADVYFVRDNGTGFEMQYADKLFGMFQRLHRADEFAGAGVGLAIAQRILRRHGGRIWADAKANKGATFYFTVGDKDLI
jgi:light-regulated signal transduction histidine kinase (bacteriophytochrome)